MSSVSYFDSTPSCAGCSSEVLPLLRRLVLRSMPPRLLSLSTTRTLTTHSHSQHTHTHNHTHTLILSSPGKKRTLPSLIVQHWNFDKKGVCEEASRILDLIHDEPLFNLSEENFSLYSDKLSPFPPLRRVRTQIDLTHPYVLTCRYQASLLSSLHPLEHFVTDEQKHLYSLRDLTLAHSGALLPALQNAVKVIHAHCLECVSCRARSFICDICNRDELLFPFEIDRTVTCKECRHVFHLECMDQLKAQQRECVVCDRIRHMKEKNA